MRSPSPETLARMSKTGPAMSPSSRTGSFENRRLSQPQLPSEVVADEERAASPVRSRSPRPEADGRLDRGFRFPVGSPSGNGVGAHGRVKEIRTNIKDSDLSPQPSPKIQTPIVHIQAPSTDGPMSAPVGYTPDETESVKEEDEEDEETADPEPTSKSTETTDVTPAEDPAPADLPPSYAEFSPAESPLPDAKDAKTDATIADDSNAEASPTDGGDDGALDEIEL